MRDALAPFESLRHFEAANPILKKREIAKRLKVSQPRYSVIRVPEIYHPKLSDAEITAIAKLLHQPADYVRNLYESAA